MIQRFPSDPVLYFCSILYHGKKFKRELFEQEWEKKFPQSEFFSTDYAPLKRYYSREMGQEQDLLRCFFFSQSSASREHLVDLKLWAIQWERRWSEQGQRLINIDIGQLGKEQMILATTKPFTHRVYLKSGVYADLTLIYQKGGYQGLPWTYPDYLETEKIEFFHKQRQKLF
jgi:hypothetical protein